MYIQSILKFEGAMYIVYFRIWFVLKNTLSTYLRIEICVVRREYIFIYFSKILDYYFYLYIKNIENSRSKLVFGTKYPFGVVWAGREF